MLLNFCSSLASWGVLLLSGNIHPADEHPWSRLETRYGVVDIRLGGDQKQLEVRGTPRSFLRATSVRLPDTLDGKPIQVVALTAFQKDQVLLLASRSGTKAPILLQGFLLNAGGATATNIILQWRFVASLEGLSTQADCAWTQAHPHLLILFEQTTGKLYYYDLLEQSLREILHLGLNSRLNQLRYVVAGGDFYQGECMERAYGLGIEIHSNSAATNPQTPFAPAGQCVFLMDRKANGRIEWMQFRFE